MESYEERSGGNSNADCEDGSHWWSGFRLGLSSRSFSTHRVRECRSVMKSWTFQDVNDATSRSFFFLTADIPITQCGLAFPSIDQTPPKFLNRKKLSNPDSSIQISRTTPPRWGLRRAISARGLAIPVYVWPYPVSSTNICILYNKWYSENGESS